MKLQIGELVEVRKSTPDGDVWVTATIRKFIFENIAVVCADGKRMEVSDKLVRKVKK